MTLDNEKTVSILNELLETCKDREQGFRTAADAVENSELQALFTSYAEQSAKFATELNAEVRRLGGDPEKSGSAAGVLHRGWMNIKSAVTSGDEGAIISECERGEDSAIKAYEDALESLSSDVRLLVEQQYTQVKAAHDSLRSLELSWKAAG